MFHLILLIFSATFVNQCMSHVYHAGTCPYVEPIKDFDMEKFLGRWYAIQKTDTQSSCLTYDFIKGTHHGEYLLEQTSEQHQTNLNASYVFSYTGKITTENIYASKMKIQFPLNIAGKASFDVITTDYKSHAAVYTCQDFMFLKRESATLLSRTKEIDGYLLKEMQLMFGEGIDALKLNTISQDFCRSSENQILLKVKSDLATSVNLIQRIKYIGKQNPIKVNLNDKPLTDQHIIVSRRNVSEIDEIDISKPVSDGKHVVEPRIDFGDEDFWNEI